MICSNVERMIVVDEVLRPVGVGGDERQVDLGLGDRRQLDLGLLGRLEQPLQRLRVLAQVDAVLLLELVGEVVDEPAVEVVAAEVGVARRSARTSTTPSPTSRMLTSKVPPPRSKTSTVSFDFLSSP